MSKRYSTNGVSIVDEIRVKAGVYFVEEVGNCLRHSPVGPSSVYKH